jgi:hypothetical protein
VNQDFPLDAIGKWIENQLPPLSSPVAMVSLPMLYKNEWNAQQPTTVVEC